MLKITPLEPERHIHQTEHHLHLDQGVDDRCELHTGTDTENRHSDGDCQLEVVAGCGERQCCGLAVIGADGVFRVSLGELVTMTLAMQRANPIRIKPVMYSG